MSSMPPDDEFGAGFVQNPEISTVKLKAGGGDKLGERCQVWPAGRPADHRCLPPESLLML